MTFNDHLNCFLLVSNGKTYVYENIDSYGKLYLIHIYIHSYFFSLCLFNYSKSYYYVSNISFQLHLNIKYYIFPEFVLLFLLDMTWKGIFPLPNNCWEVTSSRLSRHQLADSKTHQIIDIGTSNCETVLDLPSSLTLPKPKTGICHHQLILSNKAT